MACDEFFTQACDHVELLRSLLAENFQLTAIPKTNFRMAVNINTSDKLPMEENQEIWLEGVDFPLALVKQIFTNEDGSTEILYALKFYVKAVQLRA